MNYKILLIIALATVVNVSQAANKQVSIPFTDLPLQGQDYSSISFEYDLSANPNKMLICNVFNTYKAWMTYSDQGVNKETGTFGKTQMIVLSNQKETKDESKSVSVYHVDNKGTATLQDPDHPKDEPSYATCFYAIS